MSVVAQAEPEQFKKLRSWLASLPSQIDYERAEGVISRQEFLQHVRDIVSPHAIVAVYMQDHGGDDCFLTLAYAQSVQKENSSLPRTIPLTKGVAAQDNLFSFDEVDLTQFALDRDFDDILFYVLSERPNTTTELSFREDDLGLAVVFVPDQSLLSSLAKTQLRIAWRLFSIEAARSRYRRKALATEAMLKSMATSASKDELCDVLNWYCRSHSVYLYERFGNSYRITAANTENQHRGKLAPHSVDNNSVVQLLKRNHALRSHVFPNFLPESLRSIVEESAWMMLPCLANASDIMSAQKTQRSEYFLLLVGKENTEYLGEDFSRTDLSIAHTLASLLSSHLPYIGLSEKFAEIHRALDQRQLGVFDLAWYSKLARQFLPSLHFVGIFPEYPTADTAICDPGPFQVLSDSMPLSDSPRPFDVCSGLDEAGDVLNCLVFRIATEYRSEQKLVFAFDDQFIPEPQMQILNVLVEHARNESSASDFREYHIGMQAQIRHVIRGSLSAAISGIELVANRVRLYANLPTKLARLFDTPTMRDGMSDALLWLNEAFALVEAPRYLLDSFDSASIRWSDVVPATVIRSVLDICNAEARRRGVRLDFEPSEKEATHAVSADPEFIKIVIFNLIDNALKYSFQERYIRIELRFTEAHWRFEVENFGVPIRPEDRKRIFHPFVRSFRHHLANRRPGTGLGLAVNTKILMAHDEDMVFDYTSDLIAERPPTAKTIFFFELSLKGKGEAKA
ncbi:MAG: ATP-binding protein [Rhizomicrobium sp.]